MSDFFDRNTQSIKDIYDGFKNQKLIIDNSYQRRKVWIEQDQVRLIETILLKQIIPEVFFWAASVDPENGNTITHIVDGQQRINAIVEFIDCGFRLNKKDLLDRDLALEVGNKLFSELSNSYKELIWTYKISIVDINRKCSRETIKQMFNRLNLTNYSLNLAEKRHIKDSVFGDKSEALAGDDFWDKCKVFSANDARRMKDTTFCCTVYILADIGLSADIGSKIINQYYDDNKNTFDENNELLNKIRLAMDYITKLMDKQTVGFISKKVQLFSLFSVMFSFIDKNIELNNIVFMRFKNFVKAYSLYREDEQDALKDKGLGVAVDNISRYKLASSEGVNTLRILYKILTGEILGVNEQFLSIIKMLNIYDESLEQVDFLSES